MSATRLIPAEKGGVVPVGSMGLERTVCPPRSTSTWHSGARPACPSPRLIGSAGTSSSATVSSTQPWAGRAAGPGVDSEASQGAQDARARASSSAEDRSKGFPSGVAVFDDGDEQAPRVGHPQRTVDLAQVDARRDPGAGQLAELPPSQPAR